MNSRLITCVTGIALLSSACGPSDSDFSEFSTYKSPDSQYSVIIDSAHSRLAFGPETIRVYVGTKDKPERKHVITTKIANDGGGISNSNIKANWIHPDVIQLCLSGVEQEDRILEINLRNLSHTQVSKKCL